MINQLEALPVWTKFEAINSMGSGNKQRCTKESEDYIFVFAKGSKRRGYRYRLDDFLNYYKPILKSNEDKEKAWHKKCCSIENRLEVSGLWPEFKELFHNLQLVSLSDWQDIKRMSIEWDTTSTHSIEDYHKRVENRNQRIYDKYGEKYPFMFYESKEGNHYLHSDYVDSISEAKTKSMYFGRNNAQIKENIKQFIAKKEATNCDVDARYDGKLSYDISFRYKPEDNKAWYSEEYRGCGNGHYYVAIDGSAALFIEND